MTASEFDEQVKELILPDGWRFWGFTHQTVMASHQRNIYIESDKTVVLVLGYSSFSEDVMIRWGIAVARGRNREYHFNNVQEAISTMVARYMLDVR